MSAEVGSAYVSILPSAKGFGSRLGKEIDGPTAKAASAAGKKSGGVFSKGFIAPIAVGMVALKGIRVFGGFIADARESAKVGALTTQVIKSTGSAAGITAKQVGRLSTAISNKTGVDDEAIQTGANLLLTFTNLRNEQGKGNKIFDRATSIMTDMSVALGTDAKSSAIQLGKALNDPVKGISALQRVGVSFTASQKDQIAKLVKANDTLGAQKIILHELGREFGGAAAAASTPMDKLRVTLGNVGETIGGKLIPFVDRGAKLLRDFIDGMSNGTGRGGEFRDKMVELSARFKTDVLPQLKEFAAFLKTSVLPAVVSLGGSLSTSLLPAMTSLAHVVAPLVTFFAGLPGPVQLAAVAFVAAGRGASQAAPKIDAFKTKMALARGSSTGLAGGLKGVMSIFGGPWGLALAAGAAVLTTFIAKHVAAKQRIDELATSLNTATGAITAETRASVANSLEKSGALVAAQKLGISLKDLTNASLGNAGAQRRVKDSLDVANASIRQQTTAAGANAGAHNQLSAANRDLAANVNKVTGAIGSTSAEMVAAREKAARLREALGGLGDSARTAGAEFSAGLARGIIAGSGAAVAAAVGVANKITAVYRAAHEIQSPSKVAIRLGEFFSHGIAVGIKKGGKKALAAVKELADGVRAKAGDLKQQAKDMAAGIRDSVMGIVDVSAIGAAVETTTKGPSIIDRLTGAVTQGADVTTTRTPSVSETLGNFASQAKAFAAALAAMAKKGFAPALIAAVAAAGPASGLTAAQALASASTADVTSVNADMASIAKSAGAAAQTVVKTTPLPAQIKREEKHLAALERIEQVLKGGGELTAKVTGDDIVFVYDRAKKKKGRGK